MQPHSDFVPGEGNVAVRDRLVAIVLAAGVLLGMAAWQSVSPWLGIAVVLAAVAGACGVYRLDLARPPRGDEADQDRVDEVSRPRRVAGRP